MPRPICVDVLVVGLGPAGASAAAAGAESGLSVLAVDRRASVGAPVQCAEYIPAPLGKYASSPGVVVQRIRSMRTVLPSGNVAVSPCQGLMIDRARFDRTLADRATAAGAGLLTGCVLRRLDADQHLAWVCQRSPGAEQLLRVSYRLIVASDGPCSAVGAALGLKPLPVVQTRQYSVAMARPDEDIHAWLSEEFPGGYAWLFPKGDVGNLGIGVDRRLQPNLKLPLERLLARLVETGRVLPRIFGRTGGPIPVGGLRERLVHETVLFAGDAAGLTHPVSGAGIASAVVSGEMAGHAAAAYLFGKGDGALREYEEDIRDLFAGVLERAVNRRRELYSCWGCPGAQRDDRMRRGWIAFDEYYTD